MKTTRKSLLSIAFYGSLAVTSAVFAADATHLNSGQYPLIDRIARDATHQEMVTQPNAAPSSTAISVTLSTR